MYISFSTLGCPEWSWEDMLVTARDLGFDGIEIRGIENELYAPKAAPFNEANLKHTLERLDKLDLKIPCLTSSCYLFDRENVMQYIQEGKEYIDLAKKIGAPFVRVLGDSKPEPSGPIDVCFVAENLLVLAEYARKKRIKILIETNGYFANSEHMAGLMEKVGSPDIGVLWDVHHPFRFFNEPVQETYNTLKHHILFVHLKDSVMEGGKVKYKMMGYGDVPVKEALEILKHVNYEGFVSLEWVKRWCMDLEEPGIVFSQFINWVRNVTF